MKLWIECPQCLGVLKVSAPELEGPCVFCRAPIRVSVKIEAVTADLSKAKGKIEPPNGGQAGRGPTPVFTPRRKAKT